MDAAILNLEIAQTNTEENERIYRAEGNVAEADLCAANAIEYRQALMVLRRRPTADAMFEEN
jgi:hypothetical protein